MENYIIPVIFSFLTGGGLLAVINYFINKRRAVAELDKTKAETSGIKDDQTIEWRDNALHLSDEIIEKDKQVMAALREANTHALEKDRLQHHLNKCLQKVENCKCDE